MEKKEQQAREKEKAAEKKRQQQEQKRQEELRRQAERKRQQQRPAPSNKKRRVPTPDREDTRWLIGCLWPLCEAPLPLGVHGRRPAGGAWLREAGLEKPSKRIWGEEVQCALGRPLRSLPLVEASGARNARRPRRCRLRPLGSSIGKMYRCALPIQMGLASACFATLSKRSYLM